MNQTDSALPATHATVSVRLFGAFRQFGPDPTIEVALPESARVVDLRSALEDHYRDNDNALALLKASALATDQVVLSEDDSVPAGQSLSVLPPVCGG